jgi:hypothetical protein
MAAAKLGDYLTSINKSKKNLMREPDVEPQVITGYPAFMIRRLMSYHQDVVLNANEMNMLPNLDNQMQYEYFLHSVPKKNRYATTHKVQNPDTVELLKQFYNYSDAKALEVMSLHTEADFARMRAHLSEGGIIREK